MAGKGLVIAGVAAVAVALGLGGYVLIKRKKERDPNRGEEGENFDISIINGSSSGAGPVTPSNSIQQAYANLPLGKFSIEKGQKSKFVWILQSYLNCKHKANLGVDGNFGSKTEEALNKNYQVKSIQSKIQLTQMLNKPGIAESACTAVLKRQLQKAEEASNSMKNFANFV